MASKMHAIEHIVRTKLPNNVTKTRLMVVFGWPGGMRGGAGGTFVGLEICRFDLQAEFDYMGLCF